VAGIARVVIDSAVAHLDREFDYAIPEALLPSVHVGTRVRVPFAGRLLSAVVVALADTATPGVTPVTIRSAAGVSSYSPQGVALAREVARRYGGSLWDVLRLMAPARVAAVEKRFEPAERSPQSHDRLTSAADALAGLSPIPAVAGTEESQGVAPRRVVWSAPPQQDSSVVPAPGLLAFALRSVVRNPGSSSVVVLPDSRAVRRVLDAAREVGLREWTFKGGGDIAVLDHDDGPTARYEAYLAAMHGMVPLVVGTRPVALQPVPQLASMVVWDEGSDALQEQHAPYPHARTIAAMRSLLDEADLLLGAYSPSVDAAALVAHGFAVSVVPARGETREAAPAIEVLDDEAREREGGTGRHWMPSTVWRSLREAATDSAVAIQVPRTGYVNAVACAQCGTWAECTVCGGTLGIPRAGLAAVCRDCGHLHKDWHCPHCHSPRLKATRQGVEAVVEQLRAMAPGIEVHVSSASSGVLADHTVDRGIVVATPGALPAVAGGYLRLALVAADSPVQGGLGAELLALRWWLNAAALVRSRAHGGTVSVIGEIPPALRQAMVAWDPWYVATEAYQERATLGLPPARRVIALEGDQRAIEAALAVTVAGSPLSRAVDALGAVPAPSSITASPLPTGVVLLLPRGIAQEAVDGLRAVVKERSRTGTSLLRMHVDAPLP
jgi:primosomal protein N' (replication factor Y)